MTSYLEKSLKLFVEQQERWRGRVANVMTADPLTIMRDVAEQNLAIWKDMQESFLGAARPSGGSQTRKGKRDADKS